jgi:hypothetical protein
MRRTVVLVLFALFTAAMIAQTPAGTSSSQATTPQNQGQPGTAPSQAPPTGEDTQHATAGTNASPGTNQSQQASPAAGANAPVGQPATNQSVINDQVSAGAELRATLDTPLSTKTSKPGDRFTATITEPVRGTNGTTVIPAGTRVEGEVAELEEGKALPALRDKPNLSLRFRDLVVPSGQTLPLAATLISVNNTNGRNAKRSDDEGQIQSAAPNRDVAKGAGIGAGAGSAAAPVFGGPLKGFAIGALAGGGYVLATKGKAVNLPAQTGMVIKLDQPVSASQSSAAPPR